MDLWNDIPGYTGKYQINTIGEVRKLYKNGKMKTMSQYRKTGRRIPCVKLTKDGEGREYQTIQLMLMTYFPKPSEGLVAHHKDGIISNNTINNIGFITREELGRKTGARSRRQPVVKIDKNGSFLEFYSSAREAARENFMSYQTIMDRCNGKCKKALAPDGFEYAWEDKENSIKQALQRINEL